MRNETVANSLPQANLIDFIPALLTDGAGNILFTFLYGPEIKEYSRTIQHVESNQHTSSIQDSHYVKTSGRKLKLPNLLMESYGDKRSLRVLIEQLESLIVANPENGQYQTKAVYFTWGAEVFGPAVITEDFSWVETKWLSGEPAEIRLDMTLKEIPLDSISPGNQKTSEPEDQTVTAVTNGSGNRGFLSDYEQDTRFVSEALSTAIQLADQSILEVVNPTARTISLTPRQQSSAINEAQQWLKQNISFFTPKVKDDYYRQKYTLQANSSGKAFFLNSTDAALGVIGSYDGQQFSPGNYL